MKIGIIGGGAAGIMAALQIKGHEVHIFERNDRIGKKLLATGNGRCNYTNLNMGPEYYHGEERDFVKPALNYFGKEETIDFFKSHLMLSTSIENGRTYPVTLKASSVLNLFLRELDKKNIYIHTNYFLRQIEKTKGRFKLQFKDEEPFYVDRVVFATGGMSMPVSGSDGNGYRILKSLGHTLVEPFPGLVQVKLKSEFLRHLAGTKVVGEVRLIKDGKVIGREEGDLLFTKYGISGPPILDLSRKVGENLNSKLYMEIPFVNNLEKGFESFAVNAFNNSDSTLGEFIEGVCDKKFLRVVEALIKIDKNTPLRDINDSLRGKIIKVLHSTRFEVEGLNGYGESQVTCGGISTEEVNSETMESKIIKGLYLIGEALDVDGDCGGYNIQWAFSSAALCGKVLSLEDI